MKRLKLLLWLPRVLKVASLHVFKGHFDLHIKSHLCASESFSRLLSYSELALAIIVKYKYLQFVYHANEKFCKLLIKL